MSQMVPVNQKASDLRALLDKMKGQIAVALPKHLSADRMIRVAMTSVQRVPKLLDCTRESLVGAIVQASQLGLDVDGVLGHAYLVPYSNTVQLIVGYKGLVDLARRSGQISTIYARAVYEKDRFEYSYGLDQACSHVPSLEEDRGKLTHVYAVAHLKDGGRQFEVMSRAEVEAIRKRSKAGNSGPWVTDYEEMSKKTVLRRLCKMLPASVELARAVALDEHVDAGIAQQFETPIALITEEEKPAGKMDQLVAAKGKPNIKVENENGEMVPMREPGED